MDTIRSLYEKYENNLDMQNFIACCECKGMSTQEIQNGIDSVDKAVESIGKFTPVSEFEIIELMIRLL